MSVPETGLDRARTVGSGRPPSVETGRHRGVEYLFGGAQSSLAGIALHEIDERVQLIDEAIMKAKEDGRSLRYWTLSPFGLSLTSAIRRRFHILRRGGRQVADRRPADG